MRIYNRKVQGLRVRQNFKKQFDYIKYENYESDIYLNHKIKYVIFEMSEKYHRWSF